MKAIERERHDWIIIPIILAIGFLCVLVSAQWALRFAPRWELAADMESKINPNSDFLTRKPNGFIEPIDPSILTQPVWVNLFLTPGASFVTGTPFPVVPATLPPTPTPVVLLTNTVVVTGSPTHTLVYFFPTSTPKPTKTDDPAEIYTSILTDTSTLAATSTSTATPIPTDTSTPTATFTSLPPPTPTNTSDPIEPDFGAPDGNVYILSDGACLSFDLGAATAIVVGGTPESAYDLVYYEMTENSSVIFMDWMIMQIAELSGGPWYTVFNWGDSIPDLNSNISGINESDNQPINLNQLYGSSLQTGITIDIDGVGVPAGTYQWLQICAPAGGDGDGLEIDALEVLP